MTEENMDLVCAFINEISNELKQQNRTAIAWGDMFLYNHPHYNKQNKYTCNAPSAEAEAYMLARLSRDLLIADWQYDAMQAPVETVSVFQNAGFDCILCPWDRGEAQLRAAMSTVKEQALTGYLHTTWHTLTKGIHLTLLAGVGGFESIDQYQKLQARTNTATLLRKVMPCGGIYERAGWSKKQLDSIWY